jgi:hypothetical protein
MATPEVRIERIVSALDDAESELFQLSMECDAMSQIVAVKMLEAIRHVESDFCQFSAAWGGRVESTT